MTDTTQAPAHDLDADSAALVGRLAEINERIANLTSQAESIKAELRSLTPGDYASGGNTVLRIVPTRRFDADKALELVPEPLRPECYTTAVDAKKVRSYLAPALLDACMVESGKPKVVLL